eukprot:364316-Chlamydomonas_euryale.AAC.14
MCAWHRCMPSDAALGIIRVTLGIKWTYDLGWTDGWMRGDAAPWLVSRFPGFPGHGRFPRHGPGPSPGPGMALAQAQAWTRHGPDMAGFPDSQVSQEPPPTASNKERGGSLKKWGGFRLAVAFSCAPLSPIQGLGFTYPESKGGRGGLCVRASLKATGSTHKGECC